MRTPIDTASYNAQPILTAREFIAQGTTAGAIMSIAAGRPAVEAVAREVAALTGQSLKWPGQVTEERERARRRPRGDNDNRPKRQRNGAAERGAKRAQERRAA